MPMDILERFVINGYQITQITLTNGYIHRLWGKVTLNKAREMALYNFRRGEPSDVRILI